MTQHVLLDNITHQDIKVSTHYSANFGDNINSVITFPTEYGDIQKVYPILFRKDPESDEFQSVAMLGIEQDENLFLTENAWHADYIPASIVRGPFLIGFQDQSDSGGNEKAPVVHIDMDSPRLSETEGLALFNESGGQTPYMEHINTTLMGLYQGVSQSQFMFAAFTELDLIEPVDLDIKLINGEQHRLHGNYTISREKLNALSNNALAKLHASGFLEGAYLVIASLSNLQKLVNMKNKKISKNNS